MDNLPVGARWIIRVNGFVLGTRSATDQYNCDEQCFFEENTKFGVFNCPGNFFSRNFDFAKILESRKVSIEKVSDGKVFIPPRVII